MGQVANSLVYTLNKNNQVTSRATYFPLDGKSNSSVNDFDPSEKFDSLSSPHNLANQLQDAVDKVIEQTKDVDWDENYLSYRVLCEIRRALGGYVFTDLESQSNISKFEVEAYKLTGKPEQTHGDIAVVVSRLFKGGGRPVSGVGFYEAKASSLNGWDYPSFSYQQLRTLVTKTPKLSYLLYDRKPQCADSQEWPTLLESKRETFSEKQFYVRTVDANFVKQSKSLSQAVYFIGQSFGYHFVQKILSGRELDYSRPPLETIRRWLKTTRRASALVVSIAVREGKNEQISAQLRLPDFEKLMFHSLNPQAYYELPTDQPLLQEPKE